MSKSKIEKFAREFEEKIFPVLKGEDGQGINRLKKIVEKKRIDVERRKVEKLKIKEGVGK